MFPPLLRFTPAGKGGFFFWGTDRGGVIDSVAVFVAVVASVVEESQNRAKSKDERAKSKDERDVSSLVDMTGLQGRFVPLD